MKRFILSLIMLSSSVVMMAQDQVPNTEVRNLRNQAVEFNSIFKPGQVTLVSFWATWCVPCKKEIAHFKELLPAWKEEMPGLDFFTVSTDDSRSSAKVASYAAAQRWDFETYLDPNGDLKRALNFQTVPFTMIVNGEGKIVYMHTGYEEGAENEVHTKLLEIFKAETKVKATESVQNNTNKRIEAQTNSSAKPATTSTLPAETEKVMVNKTEVHE